MSATFDEWAKAVFDHAPSEREWYWDDDSEAFWDSLALSDVVVVEYMTRLFSEPSQLQNYSRISSSRAMVSDRGVLTGGHGIRRDQSRRHAGTKSQMYSVNCQLLPSICSSGCTRPSR